VCKRRRAGGGGEDMLGDMVLGNEEEDLKWVLGALEVCVPIYV
jgi:hypothetical protein